MRHHIFLVSFFSLFIVFKVAAQRGNSPYSYYALGDLVQEGGVSHMSMGGIGVATSSPAYYSSINPAFLSRHKLTCFEVGAWGESKNLLTTTALQRTQTGSLGYAGIAFPVTDSWSVGAGLNRYTSVNYFNQTEKLLPRSSVYAVLTNKGSGGINQAYVASGYDFKKKLYLGARLNFNFGSIDDQSQSLIDDGLSLFKVEQLDRTSIQDFSLRLGAAYRQSVGDEKFITVGMVYDLPANVGATSFRSRQRLTTVDVILSSDTLSRNDKKTISVPAAYKFGISYEKSFFHTIGIDISMQDWASFKGFVGTNETLTNTIKVNAGAEIAPNPNSLYNYFARVTYRVGATYTQLPLRLAGTQLDEKTVSLGASFPVSRGISAINTAFVLGTRGTIENGLIQENFFRFHLGVTINDQWFLRRKIN